jgi:hypothetical protein
MGSAIRMSRVHFWDRLGQAGVLTTNRGGESAERGIRT